MLSTWAGLKPSEPLLVQKRQRSGQEGFFVCSSLSCSTFRNSLIFCDQPVNLCELKHKNNDRNLLTS